VKLENLVKFTMELDKEITLTVNNNKIQKNEVNINTEDISVNVCKKKQLTNTRASGSDDALKLTPPKNLSLEEAIEFLGEDELLEVTPLKYRIRKRILNTQLRLKAQSRLK